MKLKYQATPCFDQEAFEMFQDLNEVPEYLKAGVKLFPDGERKLEKFGDASESLIFARQLEYVRSRLYEKKYAELKGRSLVPFTEEVGMDIEYVTYRLWDGVTLANLVSDYATDFPLVSSSAREFQARLFEFGNSYGYNMLELRRAAAAGNDMMNKDILLARRGHELAIDDAVAFGTPQFKTFGIANHPNASLVALTNGNWPAATGEDILEDLNQLVTAMFNGTLEIWQGDTMVVSTLCLRLLVTKLLNTGNSSNTTVLEMFLKQNPGISVTSWTRLATANAAGTNGRIIFYKKDPEVLEFLMGREFEVFPAQTQGLMVTFPCMSRMGGVLLHHPAAVSYADSQLI